MKHPIDNIRLSQDARDKLIRLKRDTGLTQWNVLCRWAFCMSLAEPTIPAQHHVPADSSVEMSWKTFGGPHHEIYLAVLTHRCHKDGLGIEAETLATQFRLHLHRGIGYMASGKKVRSIQDLLQRLPLEQTHDTST